MPKQKHINIAAVGSNGHQIIDLIFGLKTARLVAISNFDSVALSQIKKSYPKVLKGVPEYDSLDDVLNKSDCELVSLCSTRRDQQGDHILSCLKAGRHVLAEKPLCTSLEKLKEIRKIAQKKKLKVWAMMNMVYMPVFRNFEHLVRQGKIGEVVQVIAQKSYKFGSYRPQDRGIDGGIIQSAIHAISYVRSVTRLEFIEICAFENKVGNPGSGELQMAFALSARLSNGALCQISANYLNPNSMPQWGNDQLRIFGTRGMLEAVDSLTRVSFFSERKALRYDQKPEYPNYLSDLLKEVLTQKPAYLTMEDSLRCTEIAIEAQRSANEGGKMRCLSFGR